MVYYHDTAENIAYLARVLPAPPVVSHGWLLAEGQSVNNPSNPLNILYYGSPNQTGKIGRFATYRDPYAGLFAAAGLIHALPYYVHVREAIRSRDALAIARAIEDSPWAAGHYGGAGPRDGTIARYVRSHLPAPSPGGPDVPGLTVTQMHRVKGQVKVRGAGHDAVRVGDKGYVALADGDTKEAFYRGILSVPLDANPGDRRTVYGIGDTEAILLKMDVDDSGVTDG